MCGWMDARMDVCVFSLSFCVYVRMHVCVGGYACTITHEPIKLQS